MADKSKKQPYGGLGTNQEYSAAELARLIRALGGGIPFQFSQALADRVDTGDLLSKKARRTVPFPACADELLALIRSASPDEITTFFNEYFKFQRHRIFGDELKSQSQLTDNLDPGLLTCLASDGVLSSSSGGVTDTVWPSECCICRSCVTLDGNRNALPEIKDQPPPVLPSIKRLFAGDLVWLFYFEQMGVFQILGVILDAYASNGRIPISSSSVEPADFRDDIIALVLEVMVRQTKMGLSSTVRDRAGAYRTCLGWISNSGRKLQLDTELNTGFSTLFHQFIYNALEFFNARRMGVAIRGSAVPAPPPSVATLTTISDTLEVLKKRLEPFDYGRNSYNTLAGIVWAITGMSVIRELRATLGIPPAYSDPHEFIPAAYDLLVLKRPVTAGNTNRFIVHRDLARNGRDILLDLEVIDHRKNAPLGELDNWLNQIEPKIEAYRTAFRSLTGVDLGQSGAPSIEQQV